jgi:hypothetical protein
MNARLSAPCIRMLVSSARTRSVCAILTKRRCTRGDSTDADRWKSALMVLRLMGTPTRSYSFARLYCARLSAHLVTTTCAMKLGAYWVLSPTRSGAGAVTMCLPHPQEAVSR